MTTAQDENDERQLTRLLGAMSAGEAGASDELAERIFDDLRAMARRRLKAGGGEAGVSIQPTMLASDTLMKLIRQRERFDNGGHLFAIASRVMMRLLIDYHRTRKAQKRGGGGEFIRVELDPEQAASEPSGEGLDVEALNDVLEKLAALDARKADVVRYRVLWGLTTAEIARTLTPNVAVATVERDWAFAKAWLAKELS
jgi:RNA polymerase sigma factor (TIGR02999 family)